MLLEYIDLLYGAPIYLNGIGHVRSPKVRELTSSDGVGWKTVTEYLVFAQLSIEDLIDLFAKEHPEFAELCAAQTNLTAFDLMIAVEVMRKHLNMILNFFFEEDVSWEQGISGYLLTTKSHSPDAPVGRIDRSNYQIVFKAIRESCHLLGSDKISVPNIFTSKTAEEAWNRVQEYLAKQSKNAEKQENAKYNVGNIVAKVCGSNMGYNLFNVYDLTMFQLYDAFYQADYLRMAALDEAVFSHYGGETFKFDNWQKPVIELSS